MLRGLWLKSEKGVRLATMLRKLVGCSSCGYYATTALVSERRSSVKARVRAWATENRHNRLCTEETLDSETSSGEKKKQTGMDVCAKKKHRHEGMSSLHLT